MVFLPWSPWNCVLSHSFYRSCVCFCYSCIHSKRRRQALSEPQLANRFSVRLLWALLVILLGVPLLGVAESHISSTQGPVNKLHFLCLEVSSEGSSPSELGALPIFSPGSLTPSMGGEDKNLPSPLWGSLQPDRITAYVFTPVLMLDQLLLGSLGWGAVIMKYQLRVSWHSGHPPHSFSVSDGLPASVLVGRYREVCARVET